MLSLILFPHAQENKTTVEFVHTANILTFHVPEVIEMI